MIFIDWYLPGYKAGGAIQSVSNLVAHLKDEYDFSIITRNTDYCETIPYPNIISDEWNVFPDATRVYYFSENKLSRKFTITPLKFFREKKIDVKVILAPRGMLGKGALNIKPLRKKIFLNYSRVFKLYKDIVWHASSEQEAYEIRDNFGGDAKIIVALNLSVIPDNPWKQKNKKKGEAKFVFLSRISRKKNLRFALELLQEIHANYKISFDIIGPIEDPQYWNECLGILGSFPENIPVNIIDAIPPDEIQVRLSEYHFFLFPTEHENFGHVILEALNASCPVIISDQTPWRNLEKEKCGWDISLEDKNRWEKVMATAIDMDQNEFDVWSENAARKAKVFQQSETAVESFRKLFFEK